ncbi:MAG: nitrilotriacetate monooxygenase, partial [Acetobacteraceae bacterium]|nr:nitrilotriacetate monooxygenase [Acetobacteraceae bacterium]
MPRSTMHLNLFVLGRGHHEAAWRHKLATRRPMTDVGYYRDLARTAERGLLDSLFLADILTLGVGEGMESNAVGGLEPITLLSALAG